MRSTTGFRMVLVQHFSSSPDVERFEVLLLLSIFKGIVMKITSWVL